VIIACPLTACEKLRSLIAVRHIECTAAEAGQIIDIGAGATIEVLNPRIRIHFAEAFAWVRCPPSAYLISASLTDYFLRFHDP